MSAMTEFDETWKSSALALLSVDEGTFKEHFEGMLQEIQVSPNLSFYFLLWLTTTSL